jgi:hypothetical protein
MTKRERQSIQIDDDEGRRLNATWSRSGRRLIVTATNKSRDTMSQVELTPEQVQQLAGFMSETVRLADEER